jgi:hypothetical protein
MNAAQLIEDLKQAPPDAELCFMVNGVYPVKGIIIGKMPGETTGYVQLNAGSEPFQHDPVRVEPDQSPKP